MEIQKPLFLNKISKWLRENFTAEITKRSKIVGISFTAALLAFILIDINAFASQKFATKWLVFAMAILLSFVAGLLIAVNLHVKTKKLSQFLHWALYFLMPLFMITTVECLNGVFIYDMSYLGFFGNYILLIILYSFFFACTGSFRVAQIVINAPLFVLAVAHNYILEFRGTPLIPWDFFGVETAKNVASTYNYIPTYNIVTATVLMTIIMTVSIKTNTPRFSLKTRIITRVFSGLFAAVTLSLYFFTSVLINIGVKPDFWNQNRGYHNYGFSLMFFLNTRYLGNPDPPTGYDAQKISGIITETVTTDPNGNSNTQKQPNIICIMNESFADLSVLGNFKTNQPYMPFFNSLRENTIRGNLYVPVVGAGTSNTEFEFLTGHTTAFLPSGSNPYMLYLKAPLASMVSTLEGQGYSSLAFHPYFASGWNRTSVYENMGFDSFESIETMFPQSYLDAYYKYTADPEALIGYTEAAYPQQNILLRQYVTDSYDYKYLINHFEQRDKKKPYFAFNITMQNHGGYLNTYSNFIEDVHADSLSAEYSKTNQYLSLIKQSDLALQELIDYFKTVDEPTVICFFGDHQPTIENEFISEVLGGKSLLMLTDEEEQKRHITPFIIWANYDIEESYYERLSVNYLSTLTLKTAGVRLTPYHKFLSQLMEKLPVIDTVGYYDKNGTHYSWNTASEYSDLLNYYEILQYNNIFDSSNRNNETFYINGDASVVEKQAGKP